MDASEPDSLMRARLCKLPSRLAAQAIAKMDERPTAVFCASDEVALGLIAGLDGLGLRVPQDISVVGFDGIEQAEHFIPALTTIQQDRIALGRRAAQSLMMQLKSQDEVRLNSIELVDVELMIRESTAPIKV